MGIIASMVPSPLPSSRRDSLRRAKASITEALPRARKIELNVSAGAVQQCNPWKVTASLELRGEPHAHYLERGLFRNDALAQGENVGIVVLP